MQGQSITLQKVWLQQKLPAILSLPAAPERSTSQFFWHHAARRLPTQNTSLFIFKYISSLIQFTVQPQIARECYEHFKTSNAAEHFAS